MTSEQCTNVAETAWNLANEPDTDFAASVALRDCAVTIKELQSRIEALEKDAARYRWLREKDSEVGFSVLNVGQWVMPASCIAVTYHAAEALDSAIDTAMQKD